MKSDGGIAGEGRIVGVSKLHFWGKCTMSLTNIKSDLMSNTLSSLCIVLDYVLPYSHYYTRILGCNEQSNCTPRG